MSSQDTAPDQDKRPAMRAFLQRAETRLSTVHRVAGVFVSGAGILALFPTLVKESGSIVFIYYIQQLVSATETLCLSLDLFKNMWFFSFLILLLLPFISIFFLIKDIMLFYYVARPLGVKTREAKLNPRFSISAIAYPTDEPDHENAIQIIYRTKMKDFLLPLSQIERQYFKSLPNSIMPSTRELDHLKNHLQSITEMRLNTIGDKIDFIDKDLHLDMENSILLEDFYIINKALGLVALHDCRLIDEVARIEASLTRHIMRLRSLVLRYSKSFLISLVVFLTLMIAADILSAHDKLNYSIAEKSVLKPLVQEPTLLLSMVFLSASFVLYFVMREPIRWLKRLGHDDKVNSWIEDRDQEIIRFEKLVSNLCWLSGIFSTVSIAFINPIFCFFACLSAIAILALCRSFLKKDSQPGMQ